MTTIDDDIEALQEQVHEHERAIYTLRASLRALLMEKWRRGEEITIP